MYHYDKKRSDSSRAASSKKNKNNTMAKNKVKNNLSTNIIVERFDITG